MKKTLWTRNFIIITLGTVISAIGGTAMSFALSFVVFDNSKSTLLSGIFAAVSMVPGIVLPILISPYLDHYRRKPIIVGLDLFDGLLYLLFGLYLWGHSFQYAVYMIFSLITSSTGTIYSLAYTSLYPNLIEDGCSQKGYTVSAMIYPTVTVLMTPVASFLYSKFGMEWICIMEGILLIAASLMETQIRVEEKLHREGKFSLNSYRKDFMEGLRYLKQEKGLQRIYTYMSFTQGVNDGMGNLLVAYFRTTPGLGITLYSFFTIAEFVGRSIGGVIHYRFEIKAENRFRFAYLVYQVYNLCDGILLFLGYPIMLVNRALCGFLGVNSATLRESSVQNFIPDDKRAKLNAFFNVACSVVGMILCVGVGALGEVLDYRICLVIASVLNIVVCYLVMYRGHDQVKAVYNRQY